MLYNCQNPIKKIVNIEHLTCDHGFFQVKPREYSALSFRVHGTVTVTAAGRSYPVAANEILYIPQHLPYTAQYHDSEIIVIHFVTERDDPMPEVYRTAHPGELYKIFLCTLLRWKHMAPGYLPYTMSQIYLILERIIKEQADEQWPNEFSQAVSYINTHFREHQLSISDICTSAGISATAMRLLFSRYCQKTPVAYITKLRLENARTLLACGASVETAALESGFGDAKYLARVVKKYYRCTPRDLKMYGK